MAPLFLHQMPGAKNRAIAYARAAAEATKLPIPKPDDELPRIEVAADIFRKVIASKRGSVSLPSDVAPSIFGLDGANPRLVIASSGDTKLCAVLVVNRQRTDLFSGRERVCFKDVEGPFRFNSNFRSAVLQRPGSKIKFENLQPK